MSAKIVYLDIDPALSTVDETATPCLTTNEPRFLGFFLLTNQTGWAAGAESTQRSKDPWILPGERHKHACLDLLNRCTYLYFTNIK